MRLRMLIVDDEIDLREGLKMLLDWDALGVDIVGDAKNGEEALAKIRSLDPDLALMDIRMPKMRGLDVIRAARESGSRCRFIITSGYSDFDYAREAMQYGVAHYLTKPVDEEELTEAVEQIRSQFETETRNEDSLSVIRAQARESALRSFLLGPAGQPYDSRSISVMQAGKKQAEDLAAENSLLGLDAPVYQVVLYTSYCSTLPEAETCWDFANLLRIANRGGEDFESLSIGDRQVIVLKGPRGVQRLQDLIHRHMNSSEAGSPLSSVFLACRRPVYSLADLHLSYSDVCRLMDRRFFCEKGQHVLTWYELEDRTGRREKPMPDYSRILSQLVSSSRKSQIRPVFARMTEDFSRDEHFVEDLPLLRFTLGNLFLETKRQIQNSLSGHPVSFPEDTEIISLAGKSDYLYQITDRMAAVLELCITESGLPAGNGVVDSITDYMRQHLSEQLTLAGIADLYHYNRSYLGKLFLKVTGVNFNQYLDSLRIEESRRLLKDRSLKIYEISGRCGYSSVDYFHKKFRKATGMSPMEFRQQLSSQ